MNVERVYTDEEAVELRTAHMLAKTWVTLTLKMS